MRERSESECCFKILRSHLVAAISRIFTAKTAAKHAPFQSNVFPHRRHSEGSQGSRTIVERLSKLEYFGDPVVDPAAAARAQAKSASDAAGRAKNAGDTSAAAVTAAQAKRRGAFAVPDVAEQISVCAGHRPKPHPFDPQGPTRADP